jgi:hypothetical protein
MMCELNRKSQLKVEIGLVNLLCSPKHYPCNVIARERRIHLYYLTSSLEVDWAGSGMYCIREWRMKNGKAGFKMVSASGAVLRSA